MSPRSTAVTDAVLAAYAPPPLAPDDDKERRGRVLVVGGSPLTPGAAELAGVASLRAGAGKLQIITVEAVAQALAVAIPEALVCGLPGTPGGCLRRAAVFHAADLLRAARAVLVGPGLLGAPGEVAAIVPRVLDHVSDDAMVVLDAAAVLVLRDVPDLLRRREGRAILTPNATELAMLLGEEEASDDLEDRVWRASRRFGAAIACGRVVADDEHVFCDRAGGPGLGTSGSGDVRSGIVAGLAARRASALGAALWGAHLHMRAGDRLAERIGTVGFLARELSAEVPLEMAAITARLVPQDVPGAAAHAG
jgi:ADP-dependent NAD(P)H-hydrate dehydratase